MAFRNPSSKRFAPWTRLLGWVILLIWGAWWTTSFLRRVPELYRPAGLSLATPVYAYLGVDFIHNEAGVATWRAAGSPYPRLVGDPINPHYLPPPLTLYFFSWTTVFPPDYVVTDANHTPVLSDQVPYPARAIAIWFVASVVMLCVSTLWAIRLRKRLGLPPVPFVFGAGLTLFTYPVIFELERGNFNVLVLLFVGLGTLWRPVGRTRWIAEVLTGICAGLAAALKVFPLIMLPGLMVLRKWVAAIAMVSTVAIVWLMTAKLMIHWTYLARYMASMQVASIPGPMHSLSLCWRYLWGGGLIGQISGGTGALIAIAPAAVVVGWRLFWLPSRNHLEYPFLLWICALGTYAMMISVDYNLLLLVVATLALWDRRDPWWVHCLLIPWLLVVQPFLLVPDAYRGSPWFCSIFLAMKLWSVAAVGGLILWRTGDPLRVHADPIINPGV